MIGRNFLRIAVSACLQESQSSLEIVLPGGGNEVPIEFLLVKLMVDITNHISTYRQEEDEYKGTGQPHHRPSDSFRGVVLMNLWGSSRFVLHGLYP